VSEALTELRKGVESGPLYAALAGIAPVRTCRARQDPSGRSVVDYTFADGGQLHVERDERIEFTLQEARFASPRMIDAREILMRAERAAFAPDGCGIDWQRADTKEGGGVREVIHRGDTCNCQARVRTDGRGLVVGLSFRSTC
jgi:hypothetical protein